MPDNREAKAEVEDPVRALLLLPRHGSERSRQRWLQSTLDWLTSVPPEVRTERLRRLAADLCQGPQAHEAKDRFRCLWAEAFVPRLLSEAGLPEATSLLRELGVRLRRRFIPELI